MSTQSFYSHYSKITFGFFFFFLGCCVFQESGKHVRLWETATFLFCAVQLVTTIFFLVRRQRATMIVPEIEFEDRSKCANWQLSTVGNSKDHATEGCPSRHHNQVSSVY